jgi:hypothetical protein
LQMSKLSDFLRVFRKQLLISKLSQGEFFKLAISTLFAAYVD